MLKSSARFHDSGFAALSEVQQKAIVHILQGHDIIVESVLSMERVSVWIIGVLSQLEFPAEVAEDGKTHTFPKR